MANFPTIAEPVYPIKEKTHFPIYKSNTDSPYRIVRKRWTLSKKSWVLEWDKDCALIEADYQSLLTFFLANQGVAFNWTHTETAVTYVVTFDQDELPGDVVYPGYRTTTLALRQQ